VIGLIDFDRDGAAAEYVAIPATAVAAKPRSLSHVAAATLPLAALAAWQALAAHAALQPGERVLVQGGAGGVGIYAVQLAAYLGGHVTATGRSADAGFVQDLGADRFISIETEQPAPAAFDVVIDTVGGAVLDGSYALLRDGGRLSSPWADRPTRTGRASARSVPCFSSWSRTPASWPGWPNWPARESCGRLSARPSRWLTGGRPSKAVPGPGVPARSSWSFAERD
jgi:NADPH:quinone reductase-like Zn-dependent oxidoreductase